MAGPIGRTGVGRAEVRMEWSQVAGVAGVVLLAAVGFGTVLVRSALRAVRGARLPGLQNGVRSEVRDYGPRLLAEVTLSGTAV